MLFRLLAYRSLRIFCCQLFARPACPELAAGSLVAGLPVARWLATLLLTFATPWSNFQCSLGDRLAVGRMTLDHATGVRILLPQPGR